MSSTKAKTARSPKTVRTAKAPKEKPVTPCPIPTPPGIQLWGELVTWSMHGSPVPHTVVVEGLRANALSTDVISEILPENALTRAVNKLREERVIDRLPRDEPGVIRFQFSDKRLEDGIFNYDFDAVVMLNTETGALSCSNLELLKRAEALFHEALGLRTPSDITKVVQELFKTQRALIRDPNRTGVYVIPDEHVDFANRVHAFFTGLNGRMSRYPIPKGTAHGDSTMKTTVEEDLKADIADLNEAVEGFDIGTRDSTFEKSADKIRLARHRLLTYKDLIDDTIETAVETAETKLREKFDRLSAEKAAMKGPEATPVDAEIAAKRSAAAHKAWETMRAKKAAAEAAREAEHAEPSLAGA